MTTTSKPMPLTEVDAFPSRHIGPSAAEQQAMLDVLGYRSLDEFIDAVVPAKIRFRGSLNTGRPRTEHDVLAERSGTVGELRQELDGEVAGRHTELRDWLSA